MRGVDGHGCDDGIDFALEDPGEPKRLLAFQLAGAQETDAVLLELLEDEGEAAIDVLLLAVCLCRDGMHLLCGTHSGDVAMLDAAFDEVLDARDADHEEFVEV